MKDVYVVLIKYEDGSETEVYSVYGNEKDAKAECAYLNDPRQIYKYEYEKVSYYE